MSKIDAIGPVILFHHGFDHPDRKAQFRTGTGNRYTGVSGTNNHDLGFQGFQDFVFGNGLRWNPPASFLHIQSLLYNSFVWIPRAAQNSKGFYAVAIL